MRIVCDSCSAKYSISDDKITGKVFKVRCKKCGHVITVDGTGAGSSDPAEQESTRVFDVAAGSQASGGMADGGAIWFVVLDGQQTGPLTAAEVEMQVKSGALDLESFVWRDGMDDWIRLADVPEFAGLSAPGGAPEEGEGSYDDEATRVVSVAPGEAHPALQKAEPTPAPAPAPAAPAPARAAVKPLASGAAKAGGGFFAAAAAESKSEDLFSAPSTPAPSAPAASGGGGGAGGKSIGQRNESSVLFNLSSLPSVRGDASKKDLPTTEGSGLIDIRALASAQAATRSASPLDDAKSPSMPAAAAPIAMPAMLPLKPRGPSTGMIVGLSVMGVVIVGLIVAIVLVLGKGGDTPQGGDVAANNPPEQPAPGTGTGAVAEPTQPAQPVQPAQPAQPPVEGTGTGAGVPADGTGTGTEVPPPGTGDALAQAEPGRNDDDDDDDDRRSNEPRGEQAQQAEPRREEEPRGEEPRREQPRTETPPQTGDAVGDALSRLRRDAGSSSEPRAEEPSSGGGDVPETLDRSAVQSTIRRYNSRVARCKQSDEDAGTYRVSFTIQNSGSVTNVSPEDSGDVPQCIAGVVSDMSFPRFSGNAIPVTYPFVLR